MDAIDIRRRLPVRLRRVDAVGYQASGHAAVTESVDRGQAVPGRQRNDQLAIYHGEDVWQHDKAEI